MANQQKITILIIAFVLLAPLMAHGQTTPSVARLVCVGRNVWLVNDREAARVGPCIKQPWAVVIRMADHSTSDGPGRARREWIAALDLLKASDSTKFDPQILTSLKDRDALRQTKVRGEIIIGSSGLPLHIRNFIEQTMEFQLTQGVQVGSEYVETVRFKVTVRGPNPTIATILDAARTNMPDKKQVERAGPFFVLKRFDTREVLDEKKTVADYSLKTGDLLILGVDSRKMGIQPGVRQP